MDQIIAKLLRLDLELGKGKKVPEVCNRIGGRRTDQLSLASDVWRHTAGDGQGTQSPAEGERSSEEGGGRAGAGHGDLEGSCQGKLLISGASTATDRPRPSPFGVSDKFRPYRVLGQPRRTQRYRSRRPSDGPPLLREKRSLAWQRRRFGAGGIHRLLVERRRHINFIFIDGQSEFGALEEVWNLPWHKRNLPP